MRHLYPHEDRGLGGTRRQPHSRKLLRVLACRGLVMGVEQPLASLGSPDHTLSPEQAEQPSDLLGVFCCCHRTALPKAPGSWRSGQQSKGAAWLRPAEEPEAAGAESWAGSPAPSGGSQPQGRPLHTAGTFTGPNLCVSVCVCARAGELGSRAGEQMPFP